MKRREFLEGLAATLVAANGPIRKEEPLKEAGGFYVLEIDPEWFSQEHLEDIDWVDFGKTARRYWKEMHERLGQPAPELLILSPGIQLRKSNELPPPNSEIWNLLIQTKDD